MFQGNTKFKNIKNISIDINDFRYGLKNKDSHIWNSKNTLTVAENIEFTDKMGFKKRETAILLGDEENSGLVSWIGYSSNQIWVYDYFRCKNADFQGLNSNTGTPTWTDLWTISNISNLWSYWDVIPFYALWSVMSWTGATGTTTSWNKRWIKNIWWMTINDFVWNYITINWESKLITSNTEDQIFIEWVFETIPDTDTYTINKVTNSIYVAWLWELYSYDSVNGFRDLTGWMIQPDRIAVEHNRLWFTNVVDNDVLLYFSELWLGDHFSELSYIKLKNLWDVKSIKNIQWKIVVYFQNARVDVIWDTPDSFSVNYIFTHKWAIAGWSVANWNNMQFFLSHEWIEMLNAVDNHTIKEWLSLSDSLDLGDLTDVIDRAHWVVSNDKYFLSIKSKIYIYDIEKSLNNDKNIFTISDFTECSQIWPTVAWEWTCAKDCEWLATFGQWWNIYQIDADDPTYNELSNIIATIETWRLNRGDEKRKKVFRRVKMAFAECDRTTTFKVYTSIDWGTYTLNKTTTDFDFEVFLSTIGRDIKIKIEIEQTWTWTWWYEFLWAEIYYEPITKY